MSPETNPSFSPPPSDDSPFDVLAGGYKTYITAGITIIFNIFQAFHIFTLTSEQTNAINSVLVMGVAIFLRMGIKKAQVSAVKAAQSAQTAASVSIETQDKMPAPVKVATIDRDSFMRP